MFNPEERAELLRPKMMKSGKYLISRIGGSVQEADANKVLGMYFRYKNYINGDNEFEREWLKASLSSVWSPRFLGLVENFWSRPIEEIKKLEYQNPHYAAAYRLEGKAGDPRDYNRVFAAQVSGCTYACNFCYVPREINEANPTLGKFFSAKEIVDCFLSAKDKLESLKVLRITGGETTIIPEIIFDIYNEIEKRGLEEIYVWIDTNLSLTRCLEKVESDLKNIMQRRNVGIVGCFKGVSKEDFSMITGADKEFYEKQFETAKLLLDWKSDFYAYLPALIYENNIERKIKGFTDRLRELNKSLPLRTEILIIKEYPGAIMNIREKEKEGRPMPKTDQRIFFDFWYNKLLPKLYTKEMLSKFCCEVPL